MIQHSPITIIKALKRFGYRKENIQRKKLTMREASERV